MCVQASWVNALAGCCCLLQWAAVPLLQAICLLLVPSQAHAPLGFVALHSADSLTAPIDVIWLPSLQDTLLQALQLAILGTTLRSSAFTISPHSVGHCAVGPAGEG